MESLPPADIPPPPSAVSSCSEGIECMVGTSSKGGALKLMLGLLGFLSYKVSEGVTKASQKPMIPLCGILPVAPALGPRDPEPHVRTRIYNY